MPDLIEELAASVVDGTAVDWAAAESTADPALRRLVRHLQDVESLASLHRDAASPGLRRQCAAEAITP